MAEDSNCTSSAAGSVVGAFAALTSASSTMWDLIDVVPLCLTICDYFCETHILDKIPSLFRTPSTSPRANSPPLSTLSPTIRRCCSVRRDAWERNGAREVIAKAEANLPDGTHNALAMAKQQILNRKNLRSPAIFFGIGEEGPFSVEKVPFLLARRARHNLSFFYLNYMLATAILFCLTLLISPSAVIGIGLLGFAWAALVRATAVGSLQIKGNVHGCWCMIYDLCLTSCVIPKSSTDLP